MSSQQTMPLTELFREFLNGDETSWEEERSWIREHHPRRLARITAEISRGFFPPVRLCFKERRVVDGHHRLTAADGLGLERVPVADAWDGSDWWVYADDNPGDDAAPDSAS